MKNPPSSCGSALARALGEAVLLPGSQPYEAVMAGLFFADAGRERPACIVQPRNAEQVAVALATVRDRGGQATVRGVAGRQPGPTAATVQPAPEDADAPPVSGDATGRSATAPSGQPRPTRPDDA